MRRDPRAGLTLVELAAAVVVLAAAVAALATVIGGMVRSNGAVVERAADGAGMARALEALGRDLRAATEVEAAGEGFLRVRVDGRTVSWRLAGGRVLRNEGGRDRAWGRNVAGFSARVEEGLATVRLRGDARHGGAVPAWEASAVVSPRVEGAR